MKYFSLLLCLFGFSINFFVSTVEARLKGEGIVGGDEAYDGEIKYQIALLNDGQNYCGACILDDYHILTAAHCVVEGNGSFSNKQLVAVAGAIDLTNIDNRAVTVEVEKIFVPDEYKPYTPSSTQGDIAVLKLKYALGLAHNQRLQKVNLPSSSENFSNKRALVSGFGYNWVDVHFDGATKQFVEGPGGTYNKLRFAYADVITNPECSRANKYPIDPKQICARVVQRQTIGAEGVCSGDSGGPLVYNNKIIGVVSSSPTGCVENEGVGVYTRVTSYLTFIQNAMSNRKTYDMRTATWTIEQDQYWGTRAVLVEDY